MDYDFSEGRINVLKYGAKGDGVTDDTDAIQAAINAVSERGGGKIFFPYTKTGYRIAKPAREFVDGRPCRAQLYIPVGTANICFEGEFPCKLMYAAGLEHTGTWALGTSNTYLFSDWDAPEETDVSAMPWSLLGCVRNDDIWVAGKFGTGLVTILNLEFRVKLDPEKMYPTVTPANLQHSSRLIVRDSQFCLDRNIGRLSEGKMLQANPCHVAGLICSGQQNDDQILNNVAVQGFRYGFVINEHLAADHLYVHNCENALVFTGMSHQSMIGLVTAQHNQRIVCAAPRHLYKNEWWDGNAMITIGCVDYEPGHTDGTPKCSQLEYGVWDPENRLYGSVRHHNGWPLYEDFKVCGGAHFKVEPMNPEFSVQRNAELDGIVNELRKENQRLQNELNALRK